MLVRGVPFFLLGCAGFAAAASPELGRRIYHEGKGGDGRPLAARSGVDGATLPAAFVACVNCHAVDGRGRTEAGVTAPDIRWDNLEKPYGARLANGRRRPAYDARTFGLALARGVDPTGQALDRAMPRYEFSAKEVAGLVTYLGQIGREAVDGVSDDAIALGLVVTADVRGEFAAQVLRAWCDEVNRAGGVYRRQVQVVTFKPGEAPPAFAVLSADETEAGGAVARVLAQQGVPVLVAGRALSGTKERLLFSLYPGREDEASALARHAPAATARETWNVRPTLPRDVAPEALAEYRAFATGHALPARELAFQFALLASAKLYVEALKNAGRELSRENFVAALEGLANVQTGLTPPLGFTLRRHSATDGVYVVRGDRPLEEAEGEWVKIE